MIQRYLLAEQLIRHEGFETKAYQCPAGHASIGVGRNLEADGTPRDVALRMEITKDTALIWLGEDIAEARGFALRLMSRFGVDKGIGQVRIDVLVNMAFNLGYDDLKGFKRMWRALAQGDYVAAADEILNSRYAVQVGSRAVELALQMETGQYQMED